MILNLQFIYHCFNVLNDVQDRMILTLFFVNYRITLCMSFTVQHVLLHFLFALFFVAKNVQQYRIEDKYLFISSTVSKNFQRKDNSTQRPLQHITTTHSFTTLPAYCPMWWQPCSHHITSVTLLQQRTKYLILHITAI